MSGRAAALGRAGEDAAVALLEAHGYRIVARNVRLPGARSTSSRATATRWCSSR